VLSIRACLRALRTGAGGRPVRQREQLAALEAIRTQRREIDAWRATEDLIGDRLTDGGSKLEPVA
jgi:hypothetical protein